MRKGTREIGREREIKRKSERARKRLTEEVQPPERRIDHRNTERAISRRR